MDQDTKQFDSLGVDPLMGTEIMKLLGVSAWEINNHSRFAQLRDIVSFFKSDPDVRYQILKVLSKNSGPNKLDTLWTYVELKKEKQAQLNKLEAEDFEPAIEEQLKKGVLTRDNMKLIRKDIDNQKQKLKKQKLEDSREQKKIDNAVQKVFNETKLNSIVDTLEQVEIINQTLQKFE